MHQFVSKRIMSLIIFAASLIAACQSAASMPLVENENYKKLDNPVSVPKSGISVVEFFSYGCPYCAKNDIELEKWLATKPADVTFTRIAIPRKGKWVDYAKFYYAIEMISIQEANRITPLLYHAIHTQKEDLNDKTALINWASNHGVDKAQLAHNLASPDMDQKIKNAVKLAQDYDLEYVPSVFVDGRYQLILNSENQYRDMSDHLNALIKLARSTK